MDGLGFLSRFNSVLLIVLLGTGWINAQPSNHEDDGLRSGSVVLSNGLPASTSFPKFRLHEIRSATIPSPFQAISSIVFIIGVDSLGAEHGLLVTRLANSTMRTTTIALPHGSIDSICASEALNTSLYSEVQDTLDLCLQRSHNTLLYRWQGGVGTSATLLDLKLPYLKGWTLDGEQVQVMEHNSIAVLNWWAIWCTPCVEEIPSLNRLVREFRNNDVRFLALTPDSASAVREFLRKKRLRYLIATTSSSTEQTLGSSYPRNIVIDRSGKIVFDKVGGYAELYEELRLAIRAALQSSAK